MTTRSIHQSERIWQKDFVTALEAQGAHVQPFADKHSNGIPDLSIGLDRHDYFIECKVQKIKANGVQSRPMLAGLEERQYYWLHKRAFRGGSACFVLVFREREADYKWQGAILIQAGLINKQNWMNDHALMALGNGGAWSCQSMEAIIEAMRRSWRTAL